MSWIFLAAAAVGGGGMLWHELQRHQQEQAAQSLKATKRRTKQQLATAATSTVATSIPHAELAALEAFLQRVYRWRGWRGGPYHVAQAWQQAEAAAGGEAAGSWLQDFDLLQLTDANCDALLSVIDDIFFGKKLLKRLVSAASAATDESSAAAEVNNKSIGTAGRIGCKVVNVHGANQTWLAYFDVANVIYINQWRWDKHVTDAHPVNCEGVVCRSRLQMMLHTLAHELVHAVVFHLFPEMDKSSPAYLENDRHGPIFQLLNKHLYGHSSDALERVQLLTCQH